MRQAQVDPSELDCDGGVSLCQSDVCGYLLHLLPTSSLMRIRLSTRLGRAGFKITHCGELGEL
jgi:hypothetical protein